MVNAKLNKCVFSCLVLKESNGLKLYKPNSVMYRTFLRLGLNDVENHCGKINEQ